MLDLSTPTANAVLYSATPVTPALPTAGQLALAYIAPEGQCGGCGTAYAPSCPRSTPPVWDPTAGVRSTDPDRHAHSRRGYGPSVAERTRLRRAGGAR